MQIFILGRYLSSKMRLIVDAKFSVTRSYINMNRGRGEDKKVYSVIHKQQAIVHRLKDLEGLLI